MTKVHFLLSRCHSSCMRTSLSKVRGSDNVNSNKRGQQEMILLEENARSNPEARIHPLAHVSVDRAYQAESVGRNSLLSTLFYYSSLSNL